MVDQLMALEHLPVGFWQEIESLECSKHHIMRRYVKLNKSCFFAYKNCLQYKFVYVKNFQVKALTTSQCLAVNLLSISAWQQLKKNNRLICMHNLNKKRIRTPIMKLKKRF